MGRTLKVPVPGGPVDDGIPILISACLLGRNVRYDGGHKLAPFLIEAFDKLVRWIPVCPEVECGLPVPRESMILAGDPAAPRLRGAESRADHTDRLKRWAAVRLAELESIGLCGYVCKKNSPSCSGIGRIDVVSDSGEIAGRGSGLFTEAFAAHLPDLPVEEEGRLLDPDERESFLRKALEARRLRRPAKGAPGGGTE